MAASDVFLRPDKGDATYPNELRLYPAGADSGGGGNVMTAVLGTMTLTELVPTITQGNSLTAVLGTITLTGLVPTITQGNSLTAILGTLTLTGLVPTFNQSNGMVAPLGTITLTELIPTFTQGNTMEAPLGQLILRELIPTFVQSGSPSGGWIDGISDPLPDISSISDISHHSDGTPNMGISKDQMDAIVRRWWKL